MKIYFTAAISAMDKFGDNYKAIVNTLEKLGHSVTADHILKKDVDFILGESQEQHEKYYKWMHKQISKADLLVAEVSFPSTVHVGHELTLALEKEKPSLALFVEGRSPVLFWGITSDKFFAEKYNLDNLERTLKDSIEYLSEQMDTRFNFFISRRLSSYLDWIANNRRIPRAVYLRQLISKEMRKHRDFLEGS
jgi:hypothetical protein